MDCTAAIRQRLRLLLPDAKEIMKIGGTPGAAIAVIHEGQLLHTDYIGFRDTEAQYTIDQDTVFPCASLTKAVVCAAVALCVEDGSFEWDTPVKDILPDFRIKNKILKKLMTPVDCLSHRSGLQGTMCWLGSKNNILISDDKRLDFINGLLPVKSFRNEYLYTNLGYDVAALILKRATGDSWEHFLRRWIFDPLSMSRTYTRPCPASESNVSKSYVALDDASTVEVMPMLTSGDTVGGAGSAMRSCIRDLSKLYIEFLCAGAHQFENNVTKTPGSPLKQVPFLFSSKIAMKKSSLHETSYALGWARMQTPGPMGAIGLNPYLLHPDPLPNVGKNHPSELVLYHQGLMPGNMAAVNLIPSTKGAIIVLTNSLALNDVADWLGQMYLEAYLGVKNKNDYVTWSRKTAAAALRWYPNLLEQIARYHVPGTTAQALSAYVGFYYNRSRTLMIHIFVDNEDCLKIAFQGRADEIYPLQHYHLDVFLWLVPRDEFARRGRFTTEGLIYFKIKFIRSRVANIIDSLKWWHDKDMEEPEEFTKARIPPYRN